MGSRLGFQHFGPWTKKPVSLTNEHVQFHRCISYFHNRTIFRGGEHNIQKIKEVNSGSDYIFTAFAHLLLSVTVPFFVFMGQSTPTHQLQHTNHESQIWFDNDQYCLRFTDLQVTRCTLPVSSRGSQERMFSTQDQNTFYQIMPE